MSGRSSNLPLLILLLVAGLIFGQDDQSIPTADDIGVEQDQSSPLIRGHGDGETEDDDSEDGSEDPDPEGDTGSDIPDRETEGETSEEDTESEASDEGEDQGDSFLDPYYESEDSGGCSMPGCSDSWDIIRMVAAVRVCYRSDPLADGGGRVMLGSDGNPAALDMRFSPFYFEDGTGYSGSVMFRTPSPWVLETTYHRSEPEDEPGFSILYASLLSQMVYGSPLQIMAGGHVVFPWEDERETLSGAGAVLLCNLQLPPGLAFTLDYRLSWVRSLPLHRGQVTVGWLSSPMEAGAGYMFLRNSGGEVVSGPCIQLGLFF